MIYWKLLPWEFLSSILIMCGERRKISIYFILTSLSASCKAIMWKWDLKKNRQWNVLCGRIINFKYMQHQIPKFHSAIVIDCGTKLEILHSKCYFEYIFLIPKGLWSIWKWFDLKNGKIKNLLWPSTCMNEKYSLQREIVCTIKHHPNSSVWSAGKTWPS